MPRREAEGPCRLRGRLRTLSGRDWSVHDCSSDVCAMVRVCICMCIAAAAKCGHAARPSGLHMAAHACAGRGSRVAGRPGAAHPTPTSTGPQIPARRRSGTHSATRRRRRSCARAARRAHARTEVCSCLAPSLGKGSPVDFILQLTLFAMCGSNDVVVVAFRNATLPLTTLSGVSSKVITCTDPATVTSRPFRDRFSLVRENLEMKEKAKR